MGAVKSKSARDWAVAAVLLSVAALWPVPFSPAENRARSPGVGGFRAILADAWWLKAASAWERRDAAGTRFYLDLTLETNPGPEYFWLNGARMLAFDLPAWSADLDPATGQATRASARKMAAREALHLLERGLRSHPDSASLRIEMATISLYGLGDRRAAAVQFQRAAQGHGAPRFADRLARSLGNP